MERMAKEEKLRLQGQTIKRSKTERVISEMQRLKRRRVKVDADGAVLGDGDAAPDSPGPTKR